MNEIPDARDIPLKSWEFFCDLILIQQGIEKRHGKKISIQAASVIYAMSEGLDESTPSILIALKEETI